eukprot:2871423-Prymnesium_polylepis.1
MTSDRGGMQLKSPPGPAGPEVRVLRDETLPESPNYALLDLIILDRASTSGPQTRRRHQRPDRVDARSRSLARPARWQWHSGMRSQPKRLASPVARRGPDVTAVGLGRRRRPNP